MFFAPNRGRNAAVPASAIERMMDRWEVPEKGKLPGTVISCPGCPELNGMQLWYCLFTMATPFDHLDIPDWVKNAWTEPMTQNDVLFRSVKAGEAGAHNWETNAVVSRTSDYAYAEGYRRAARLLADYAISEKWDIDFLVYPIAFMYRHNIELQLKRLIPDAAFLANVALSDDNRKPLRSSHRLDELWGLFKSLLAHLEGEFGLNMDDLKAIESYINQIHQIDDLSFSFRYITRKSGDPSIDTTKLPHINIGVLANAMEKLTGYFSGLGDAFEESVKAEYEMRAEAYADYRSAYADGG